MPKITFSDPLQIVQFEQELDLYEVVENIIEGLRTISEKGPEIVASARLPDYMAYRLAYLLNWTARIPDLFGPERGGKTWSITDLRESLQNRRVPQKPKQITVEGAFFPAVLLYSGWWERDQDKRTIEKIQWQDGLQAWLFNGFEQWGPSFDLNPHGSQTGSYLFGQIGSGDEANSLPVIVPNAKAGNLREQLHERHEIHDNLPRAFSVKATGLLCHRQHIGQHVADEVLLRKIKGWGENFDYLLILAEKKEHQIEPAGDLPGMYSGYLWQCYTPRKWLEDVDYEEASKVIINPPSLEKTYFLWEHTDFTKPDAVKYNIESLQNKLKYLEDKRGKMILLQKSSEILPGKQAMKPDIFYAYVNSRWEM